MEPEANAAKSACMTYENGELCRNVVRTHVNLSSYVTAHFTAYVTVHVTACIAAYVTTSALT
jgi:hypothetical protein